MNVGVEAWKVIIISMIFILFVIFLWNKIAGVQNRTGAYTPTPSPPPDIESRVCIHKATLHKKVNCAADAVIWAEHQLVAIPGWLLKCQNARLDQEGQLTSRKWPRSLIIKKNKAKRRTIYCEERGNKMGTQAIPQWQLWGQDLRIFRKTPGFVEKWRISEKSDRLQKKSGGFKANSQVVSLGESLADFP